MKQHGSNPRARASARQRQATLARAERQQQRRDRPRLEGSGRLDTVYAVAVGGCPADVMGDTFKALHDQLIERYARRYSPVQGGVFDAGAWMAALGRYLAADIVRGLDEHLTRYPDHVVVFAMVEVLAADIVRPT